MEDGELDVMESISTSLVILNGYVQKQQLGST